MTDGSGGAQEVVRPSDIDFFRAVLLQGGTAGSLWLRHLCPGFKASRGPLDDTGCCLVSVGFEIRGGGSGL